MGPLPYRYRSRASVLAVLLTACGGAGRPAAHTPPDASTETAVPVAVVAPAPDAGLLPEPQLRPSVPQLGPSAPQLGPSAHGLVIETGRRSTSGDIASRNLHSQVDAAAAHFERTGGAAMRSRLLALLSLRSSMLGGYDDFARMDALTDEALQHAPNDPLALLERASFLRAVHRFDQATALLDRAQAQGLEPERLAADRLTIDLAQGRDPQALLDAARRLVAGSSSYAHRVLHAGVLASAGRFMQADAAYRDALADYRDSSPFIFAWNAFQRGVMWAEAADRPELALPLYREAVRRLPGYAVATVHLAELEASMGAADAAIARLRDLVATGVADPEPYGYLAELLLAQGTGAVHEEAAARLAHARQAYAGLLERYPAAFADHGSEFFAGVGGDPERAVSLALFNLERRTNARAYVVAIGAASAAGQLPLLCELVAQSSAASMYHPALDRERRTAECPDSE